MPKKTEGEHVLSVRMPNEDKDKLEALRKAATGDVPTRTEVVLRLIRDAYDAGPGKAKGKR
jgi:hypothetical protein